MHTPNNALNNKGRLNSLDNLRSLAIILVMVFHYSFFISHTDNFGIISEIGWIGVDLFFVLSGYLISSHIFTALQAEKFSLIKFYIKRFFKTLPNYYIVLILYISISGFAEKPIIVPIWKYLIFIQNFNLPVSGFSQSWSLCVEEQFYLIFPFVAIWLCRKNRNILIYILILAMLFGLILRGMLWHRLDITNNLKSFFTTIYYPTYCRLDGFIDGIIVAYIQNYYYNTWQRILNYSNILLCIGLLILTCFIFIITNLRGFLTATIGFPGIALGFAIIMLAALSSESLLSKFNSLFMNKLAKWSYAIYLLQKPVSVICANYFNQIGLNNNSYIIIFINFTIQVFAGIILFYCIENNFMIVRDKLLKKLD